MLESAVVCVKAMYLGCGPGFFESFGDTERIWISGDWEGLTSADSWDTWGRPARCCGNNDHGTGSTGVKNASEKTR